MKKSIGRDKSTVFMISEKAARDYLLVCRSKYNGIDKDTLNTAIGLLLEEIENI